MHLYRQLEAASLLTKSNVEIKHKYPPTPFKEMNFDAEKRIHLYRQYSLMVFRATKSDPRPKDEASVSQKMKDMPEIPRRRRPDNLKKRGAEGNNRSLLTQNQQIYPLG